MKTESKPSTDADRFRDFAQRLVAVPKTEIDRREMAEQRAKERKAKKASA